MEETHDTTTHDSHETTHDLATETFPAETPVHSEHDGAEHIPHPPPPEPAPEPRVEATDTHSEVTTTDAPIEPAPHISALPLVATLAAAIFASIVLHRLSTKELLRRLSHLFPLAHVLVWCVALLVCASWAARTLTSEWLLVCTLIFLSAAYINAGWLRSVLAGVTLSLERRLRIGDEILAGDLQGVVSGFGLRAIHLRADDGSLHDVPNDLLVNTPVTNLTGDGGDSACDVTLDIPSHITHEQALQIAHRSAILSPLASPRHRPHAFLTPPNSADGPFRVTVRGYAFDPHHRDHFKSDVLARATRELGQSPIQPPTRSVVGYDGPSPDSAG